MSFLKEKVDIDGTADEIEGPENNPEEDVPHQGHGIQATHGCSKSCAWVD